MLKKQLLMYWLELLLAKILQVVDKAVPLSQVLPGNLAFALHLDWDLDPVPILEQVTCPVLAIFGELDKLVPVEQSVKTMKKGFKNTNYTLKIFPGGNHALIESEVGVWSEIPRLKRKVFVPGYYSLISNWILEGR